MVVPNSTFFSLPLWKKLTNLLSVDQAGNVAPSLPVTGGDANESTECSQRPAEPPSPPNAMNASRRPSGETRAAPEDSVAFSGPGIVNRTTPIPGATALTNG